MIKTRDLPECEGATSVRIGVLATCRNTRLLPDSGKYLQVVISSTANEKSMLHGYVGPYSQTRPGQLTAREQFVSKHLQIAVATHSLPG